MSAAIHTPPPSDHASSSDSRTGDPSRPQSPVDPMDEDGLSPPPGTACTQCASTSSSHWRRDKDGSFVCNNCGMFPTHPMRVASLSPVSSSLHHLQPENTSNASPPRSFPLPQTHDRIPCAREADASHPHPCRFPLTQATPRRNMPR